MRPFLILCLGIFLSLARLPAAAEGDPELWLLGDWKSNADLTIPSLKTEPPMTPEVKESMRSLFGHMTLSFDREFCLSVMPELEARGRKFRGSRDKSKYYVESSTEKTISLRIKDHRTMKEMVQVFTFDTPNRFWVELPKQPPLLSGREYFERFVKKEEAKPTSAPTPLPAKPAK